MWIPKLQWRSLLFPAVEMHEMSFNNVCPLLIWSSAPTEVCFFIGCHRPIAGHANLCPDSISTKPQDLGTLLSTVKHEILHALGFSVSLYAYFRDRNGYPLTPRERNGKPSVNKEWAFYSYIVSCLECLAVSFLCCTACLLCCHIYLNLGWPVIVILCWQQPWNEQANDMKDIIWAKGKLKLQ